MIYRWRCMIHGSSMISDISLTISIISMIPDDFLRAALYGQAGSAELFYKLLPWFNLLSESRKECWRLKNIGDIINSCSSRHGIGWCSNSFSTLAVVLKTKIFIWLNANNWRWPKMYKLPNNVLWVKLAWQEKIIVRNNCNRSVRKTRRSATTGIYFALRLLERCFLKGWKRFFRKNVLSSANTLMIPYLILSTFFIQKTSQFRRKKNISNN